MRDGAEIFDQSLAGLNRHDWRARLAEIGQAHGRFDALGARHFSVLVQQGATLLVTFETAQGIKALDENAHPFGWELIARHGWSHLAIVSDGDTWGRDSAVYAYFDMLTDEGFFDQHDRVVFYGAGPCGYAAAAFSVAAPGATVVAVQPQATLDPDVTGWDERFTEERRRDFTSRYGYAPEMLDAAQAAFVIYDPSVALDAMHAALFRRAPVTRLPVRRLGATVQTDLMRMEILHKLIEYCAAGQLNRVQFAKLMRARRSYTPYLRNVLSQLEAGDRRGLARQFCRAVTARMEVPGFARHLQETDAGPQS